MNRLLIGAHYLGYAALLSLFIIVANVILSKEYKELSKRSFQIVVRFLFFTYLLTTGWILGVFSVSSWHLPYYITFNLVPFVNESVELIILNVLLFIPLGTLSPFVFHRMRKTRSASLCFLLTCLTIEVAQGLFLGRIFDVDDIVANLAGCFFGYGLWVILWKARSRYFASVDLNTYASLLLTVTFSLCGISYARFSILDVVLTSYGIPTWSGNDGWIISQSGIHYSNIFLIALLLIPLGMSIPVWRNRQTRLPAITALIAILAFSSLTVLQYYK